MDQSRFSENLAWGSRFHAGREHGLLIGRDAVAGDRRLPWPRGHWSAEPRPGGGDAGEKGQSLSPGPRSGASFLTPHGAATPKLRALPRTSHFGLDYFKALICYKPNKKKQYLHSTAEKVLGSPLTGRQRGADFSGCSTFVLEVHLL